MKKDKLYLITFGKSPLPVHSMMIQFTEYCVKDYRKYMKFETVAHTTDKGISLIKTMTRYMEPKNINSYEPVDIKDLPLYLEWTKSRLFEELLKG